MKKFLWILLIFLVSFTACAGSGKPDKNGTDVSKVKRTKQEEEYVYQPEFKTFPAKIQLVKRLCSDGGQLMAVGTGENHTYFLRCGSDGNKVEEKEISLDIAPDFAWIDPDQDGGTIYLVTYDTEGEKESNTGYYLHTVDFNGKVLSSCGLNLSSKTDFYLGTETAFVTKDGSFYAASGESVFAFDLEGNQTGVYRFGGDIQGMYLLDEARIFVFGNMADNSGSMWKIFDRENESFGEAWYQKDYRLFSVSICSAEENILFLEDSQNLYRLDMEQNQLTIEFSWLEAGVGGTFRSSPVINENGEIYLLQLKEGGQGGNEMEMVCLKKEKEERTVLTLACRGLSEFMEEKIVDFNKNNKNYRIKIEDYSNYEDAGTQMDLDIAAGNIPDIIVTAQVPVKKYVKKGLFTDLYALMEDDSEVKKEDLIPSVRKAAEIDGKLYYFSPGFSVEGLIGSKKLLGNRTGWTVGEMKKLYEKLPKGGVFELGSNRQIFLQAYMREQAENYVNWQTGEVSFDSGQFMDILEFSKSLPEEAVPVDRVSGIQKGKILTETLDLSELASLQVCSALYKDVGGFTVLGWPSEDKAETLSMNFHSMGMGISEQCEYKEGAWEFLRQFFTYEGQKKINWKEEDGFPTRTDALETWLSYFRAKKKYTDSDGTVVKPIKGSMSFDGVKIPLGPLTKKEEKIILEMIDRVGILGGYDEEVKNISNIVMEEAGSYYAGDKTLEETAEIIQNRVEIYVSEVS